MNKTYLLVILAAVLVMFGCTKVEVIDVQGEVLTVKEVPVTAGSFQLPITVKGEDKLVWKVRPIHSWLHVDDAEWKQNAYNVLVRYDSNESSMNVRNFARVGHLVVETYDGFVADTIVVKQRGLTPFMELEDTTVDAATTECEISFNSNLTDACRPTMAYAADVEWVESIEYLGCGTHLLVKFSANGGAERSANITVSFTDGSKAYIDLTIGSSGSTTTANPSLSASSTTVKGGNGVTLTLSNCPSYSTVTWSMTDNTGKASLSSTSTITDLNNKATVTLSTGTVESQKTIVVYANIGSTTVASLTITVNP